MKNGNRILGAVLALLTLALLLPAQALAAGSIDLDRESRLTLSCQAGGTPLAGAQLSLYLVATADESGELTATSDFASFHVNIRGQNDAAWNTLAATLEGYILRDGVTPVDSGTTNGQGLLTFPTGEAKLAAGLYLVLGTRHTQGGFVCDAQPFLVMLPTLDREANDWLYDVTVNPKYEAHPIPNGDTITRKVLKLWEDDGQEENRPTEVVVQLLCSGRVYDTVTLNDANNWRYTWSGLDAACTWTVVEQVPEDYTVAVAREGVTFVVTNTYAGASPDAPPPTNPTDPTQPTDPATPTNPAQPGSDTPTLPQTGQLWWPVPVLLAAGMLLVLGGLIRRRGTADKEK